MNGATGECSGRGNCSSGIDGDGLCDCEVMYKEAMHIIINKERC